MNNEIVLILDFGGQYSQLIARKIRECNVYCEVHSYKLSINEIKKYNPKGIIFTGGPNSVNQDNAPKVSKEIYELGIPILGICYGSQLIAVMNGGKVSTGVSEYGKTLIEYDHTPIFDNIPNNSVCWMSHTEYIEKLPDKFESIAHTSNCYNAGIVNKSKNIYGIQFHLEVSHTEYGQEILKNFLYNICNCGKLWTMGNYAVESINILKNKINNKKVLLALSGGVDSAVCAGLVSKAVGSQLTCVFVDHGFMRKDEAEEIEEVFKKWNINFIKVNAQSKFLNRLNDITDPEEKRKAIGEEFIRVFENQSTNLGHFEYLVQGTIYPDVIESGIGESAIIKSHHNVGGLPSVINFKEIIEPLRMLFKDEVRKLGLELGLPLKLINRQPFPGPGLAIRIIGKVTQKKLDILRDADFIFRSELEKANIYSDQYFAVLTSVRSVGVKGDYRTYEYTLALRAVTTTDFMTAECLEIPYSVLFKISSRVINEVNSINRVVYDITTKPPSTIEWE